LPLLLFFFCQVCGPPGMMNHISGDKAKDRSQGEVLNYLLILFLLIISYYISCNLMFLS
jgi:hypothetical protein